MRFDEVKYLQESADVLIEPDEFIRIGRNGIIIIARIRLPLLQVNR